MTKRQFSTHMEVQSIKLLAKGERPVQHTDSALRYLKLRVSDRRLVWHFEKRVDHRDYFVKLGEFPALGLSEARDAARDMLIAIQRGEYRHKSDGPRTADITLAEGLEIVLERVPSEATKKLYRSTWRNHLSHFGKRKMIAFASEHETVRLWHEKLVARTSAATTHNAVALLKSIYSHTTKRHPEMLKAPVITLDERPVPPATYDLSATSLARHVRAVQKVRNTMKRDANLFLYFSGMRVSAALNTRWEQVSSTHINYRAEDMKTDAAFTLPITRQMQEIIARQRGNGSPYVFFGQNLTNPMSTYKARGGWTGRMARSHFNTVAHEVVPYVFAELLTAHALPGMTASYVRPALADLAVHIQTINDALEARTRASMGGKDE